MKKKYVLPLFVGILALAACSPKSEMPSESTDNSINTSIPTDDSSKTSIPTERASTTITEPEESKTSEITRVNDIFFSEYAEGSNENRYLELFNATGKQVNLSGYSIELYANGKTDVTKVLNLDATLDDGKTYVIASAKASKEILAKATIKSDVTNFNGDDTIVLKNNDKIIDIIGKIGERPANGFKVNDASTIDHTLIRDKSVLGGSTTFNEEEWIALDKDDFSNIGIHEANNYQAPIEKPTDTPTTTEPVVTEVLRDLSAVYDLIKKLPINDKGTAYSENYITVELTAIASVEEETKLFYLTDGSYHIKAHAEKLHNYLEEGTSYKIKCKYASYLYIPSLEIENPQSDITRIDTLITDYQTTSYDLKKIVSAKKENLVDNIESNMLTSILSVTGYLVLDTHNSNSYDYLLVPSLNYQKNDTQYIKDALYFKNDSNNISELAEYINQEVTLTVFIYDYNPNRKDWRCYYYTLEA